LKVVVPEELIWLQADGARIAQVITNVLNNSPKYTPRNGEIVRQARLSEDRAPEDLVESSLTSGRIRGRSTPQETAMAEKGDPCVDSWVLDLLEEYRGESRTSGAIAVEVGLPTPIAERSLRRLHQSGRVQLIAGSNPSRWRLTPRGPEANRRPAASENGRDEGLRRPRVPKNRLDRQTRDES
jgi:hypothetical protein